MKKSAPLQVTDVNLRSSILRMLPALIFLLGISMPTVSTQARKFFIIGDSESDSIFFLSDSELDYTDGTSHSLRGVITFNPDSAREQDVGFLRVASSNVRMHLNLNDNQEPLDHRDPEAHPFIDIALKSIDGLPEVLPPDSPVNCELQAEFKVYGVVRSVMTPAEVWLYAQDDDTDAIALEIRTDFQVLLDDFKLPSTQLDLLDHMRQLNIHLHFVASSILSPDRY